MTSTEHSSTSPTVTIVCILVGTCALGSPALARQSAYDQLDNTQLAESLAELGMTELLEALTSDPRMMSSARGRMLRAEGLIGLAESERADLQRHDRLLDDAVQILRELIKQTRDPEDDQHLIENLSYRLLLADAEWRVRVAPYVERLRYLHGGISERVTILNLTADAPRFLRTLNNEIRRTLEDARLDENQFVKLITVIPKLEEVRRKARYKSAWIRLYRAIALDRDIPEQRREKEQLLLDAILEAKDISDDEEATSLKKPSLLLAGIACRELQKYSDAVSYLEQLTDEHTEANLRTEALYEAARTRIEQGDMPGAVNAINRYLRVGYELLEGESPGRVRVDAMVAMLRSYLYETLGKQHAQDPDKVREYSDKARQALLDFIRKHDDPELQEDFLWMVAGRYSDRKDLKNLGSLTLLGIGIRQYWSRSDLNKAEQALEWVLNRNDEISREVRPLVLWRLGLLMDQLGNHPRAGDMFLRFAQEYPSHQRGYVSCTNAVNSYLAGMEDNPNARGKLIKALELVVAPDRWNQSKQDTGKWYFELGWWYQKAAEQAQGAEKSRQRDRTVIAWMNKAITAYAQVPPDHPAYMEGQHLRLELEADLPDFVARTPQERLEMFQRMNLVNRLRDYSEKTSAATAKSQDPSRRKSLRSWAGRAELREVQILYELGERDVVWDRLDQLPDKYRDTPVLVDATVFHIRKLIEEARNDPGMLQKAIEKAEEFRRHHPLHAELTIQLIVRKIRNRIRSLRSEEGKQTELQGYRTAYAKFAEYLFIPVKDAPIKQRYALTQMYASSLLEKGISEQPGRGWEHACQFYEKALGYFRECEDYDKSARETRRKQINSRFDKELQGIERASNSVTGVRQVANRYFETVRKDYHKDVDNYAPALALRDTLDQLHRARDLTEQKQWLAWAGRKLRLGYEALRRMELSRLPIDPENYRGLARAHQRLHQYREAGRWYNKLLEGIDRNRNPALYWSIQLEQCRCVLEGFAQDRKIMRDLTVQIQQLRLMDEEGRATEKDEHQVPGMGGLLDQFTRIESEAQKLAQNPPQSKR